MFILYSQWSFGVLLWELMTRGMQPYPDVPSDRILEHIRGGTRLPRPDTCPEEMFVDNVI